MRGVMRVVLLRLTCWGSSHNSKSRHGLSADIVTVEQESCQFLHAVKLTTQNLLGPFTHQTAGSRAHLVLSAGRLTRRLQQLTLIEERRDISEKRDL